MSLKIRDIENSVKAGSLIKDTLISKGTPQKAWRGLVKYVGGFAVVFPFDVNGEKWAYRCLYADLGNVERRLKTLSQGLNKLDLPYFTPFYYEPEGIEIDGKLYPTTRMKWVAGKTIIEYICNNKHRSEQLFKLADEFYTMCKTLHKHKISHGDLQHGNILIDDKGAIHLIDYDSVYIPDLNGYSDNIKGLPDYQHPLRIENKVANEKMDYFSELIIYISILAIAEKPDLVRKYKLNEDSEKMLFTADDYRDLKASNIYSDLSQLSDKVKMLLSILQEYLTKTSILDLEPFHEAFEYMQASLTISKKKIRKGKESARLTWKVISSSKIVLLANGKELQKCDNQGFLDVTPEVDTNYCLKIQYTDSNKFDERKVQLLVRPEATVEFFPDKDYTLPGVPIKLSWNVRNASSVIYNGQKKNLNDSIILKEGIEKEADFSISVTDEFETKEHHTKVRMLPMPVIETLLVPTPEIEDSVNVVANMPIQFNDGKLSSFKMPTINYDDIANITKDMPSFINMPIMPTPNFELPKTLPEKINEKMATYYNNIEIAIENTIQKFNSILNRNNQ